MEKNFSSLYQEVFKKTQLLKTFEVSRVGRLKQIQAHLNEGSSLYNLKYPAGGNIKKSGKKFKQDLQRAKRILEEKGIQAARPLISAIKEEELRKQFVALNYRLRDEQTWKKLLENVSSSQAKKIRVLQKNWMNNCKFSHFTLDQMISSIDLLEELTGLLRLAENEFRAKNKRFTQEEREEYVNFISEYNKQLKAEKKALANNLFARCQLAILSGNFKNHNLTLDLLENFEGLNLVSGEFVKSMRQTQDLTSKIDLSFCTSYILKYASHQFKEKTTEQLVIQGYHSDDSVKLTFKNIAGVNCLIPEGLAAYIPNKMRKPKWFFIGQRERYKFFLDKGPLLFRMVSSQLIREDVSVTFDTLSESLAWSQLRHLQYDIEQAENNANKLAKKRFLIFRRKSQTFYNKWREFLAEQQCKVLKKQIELLEHISQAPTSISDVFEKPSMENEKRILMVTVLSQLNESLSKYNLDESDNSRFKIVKNVLLKRCQSDETIEATQLGLKQLANGEFLIEKDFTGLYHHINTLSEERLLKTFNNNQETLAAIIERIKLFLADQPKNLQVLADTNFAVLNQSIQMIQLFFNIQDFQKKILNELSTPIKVFMAQYRIYLREQSPDALKNNKKPLEQLEKQIKLLLITNPEWKGGFDEFLLISNDRLLFEQGLQPIRSAEALDEARLIFQEALTVTRSSHKNQQERAGKVGLHLAANLPNDSRGWQESGSGTEETNSENLLAEAERINKQAKLNCVKERFNQEVTLSDVKDNLFFAQKSDKSLLPATDVRISQQFNNS